MKEIRADMKMDMNVFKEEIKGRNKKHERRNERYEDGREHS
jgi:hypothetical protein